MAQKLPARGAVDRTASERMQFGLNKIV